MKKLIAALVPALMLSLTACMDNSTAPSPQSELPAAAPSASSVAVSSSQAEKPVVPDFTLPASNGEDVSLSDFAGRVVVLNFWATWCPYCLEEMPDLQRFQNELHEDTGPVLLMVNQTYGNETREQAEQYLADNDYDFLTLFDDGSVANDIFAVPGLPTTVIIDGEGRLSAGRVGPIDYDTLQALVREAS